MADETSGNVPQVVETALDAARIAGAGIKAAVDNIPADNARTNEAALAVKKSWMMEHRGELIDTAVHDAEKTYINMVSGHLNPADPDPKAVTASTIRLVQIAANDPQLQKLEEQLYAPASGKKELQAYHARLGELVGPDSIDIGTVQDFLAQTSPYDKDLVQSLVNADKKQTAAGQEPQAQR